jgi:hypothetical protein
VQKSFKLLIIFAPRVTTRNTSKESYFALVCRTQLSKPPISFIVTAFCAMRFNSRFPLVRLTLYYQHLSRVPRDFVDVLFLDQLILRFFKTTRSTRQETLFGNHNALAFRTEFHSFSQLPIKHQALIRESFVFRTLNT